MFVNRIPVIIKDSDGELKAAGVGNSMADDEGMTIIVFDDVTLENGESMSFTISEDGD